ncbi:MAG: AsmA-like C-terminal region-containing protein, partial [Pseudomonadota bacterium]
EVISLEGTTAPISKLTANQNYEVSLNLVHEHASATVNGTIEKPLDATGINLQTRLKIDELADLLGLENVTRDLGDPLVLDTRVLGSLQEIEVKDIKIDNSAIKLNGKAMLKLSQSIPEISFNIASEHFRLDSILPETEPSIDEREGRLFSSTPFTINEIPKVLVKGKVNLAEISYKNYKITGTTGEIRGENSLFLVENVSGSLAGGQFDLSATANLQTPKTPNVKVKAQASQLNLAQLTLEDGSQIGHSGVVDFSIESQGSGDSLAAIMAKSNGSIAVDLHDARLHEQASKITGGGLLLTILNGLNPLSKDSAAHIECASIRFPVRNGIATSETGIGIRTPQLNILGGGEINFASEEISFKAKPKPRKGIGLNVASLADFVGIGGTLMNPAPATDAKGLASAGVKIGAALATGGISLLAEGLFDRASSDVDVCAVARGETQISKDNATPGAIEVKEQAPPTTGGKIKGVLKGIFGK